MPGALLASPRSLCPLLIVALFPGCGGSATTNVSGPTPTRCAVSISNSAPEIPASGGTGTVALNTARECTWSASSKDSWITLSTTNGQGEAAINYTVQRNPNGTRRQGQVAVSDQTVEVTQAAAPCQYSVSPSNADTSFTEGELSVALTATPGCSWNAHSSVDWASPIPNSGIGSATVRIVIAGNTSQARTGTVTLGDATLRVNQTAAATPTPPSAPAPPAPPPTPAPAPTPPPTPAPPAPTPAPTPTPLPCTYGVSPTRVSIDATGGQRSITVTSGQNCTWEATTTVNWIDVTSGSEGTGDGSVTVSIGRNSGAARTASVTVASQTVTIDQAAPVAPPCSYRIKPNNYHAERRADDVEIEVTTDAGCPWTASSNVSWVTVANGASGVGKGKVRLVIEANEGPARSTVLTIAGLPFDLKQDGRK